MDNMNKTVGETAPTMDEQVKLLFASLQAKKAEIAAADRPQYITGGSFRYSESVGNTIDIVSARDERKLAEIAGFLEERQHFYAIGAEKLGVKADFTWLGFTVEEWLKDLKTRVTILQIAKRRAELIALETRVNAVVTPELRRQMEMEALQAILLG